MKKKTDELLNELKSSESIEEYFDKNDSEIFFGTLADLISSHMARKGLKKTDIVKRSGLNREYCYEIIRGSTDKKVSRDKVIMLCFGLGLNIDESQQLLKKSGNAPIYTRDSRDIIIGYSLEHGISVVDTNIKLADYNLEPLE